MVEFAADLRLTLTPRRRWFRFSLRTLFVAITVLSIAFGFYVNRVQNEWWAAKAIQAANGEIVYDCRIQRCTVPPAGPPVPPGPTWLRKWLGPAWLDRIVCVRLDARFSKSDKNKFSKVGPHLQRLTALRMLTLSGEELDADDYHLLGKCTQLESLTLRQKAELRPQDAAALAGAVGLRELYLDEAKISPEALRELSKLPNLEKLDIDCNSYDPQTGNVLLEFQLEDDAARTIATFPKLRFLYLFATKITDKGMSELGRLSTLEELVVSSPHITSSSFDAIVNLKRLKHLGTWQWKIEAAGHFAKLSQLPLCGEQITDASIPYLIPLKKLKWLDAHDTNIHRLGPAAAELQQALPTCAIVLPRTSRKKHAKRPFQEWNWAHRMGQ